MSQPYADFARVNKHIQKVIAAIEPHDSVDRFESLGITVIKSMASFIDDKTVHADECLIKAKYFVLATGSRPRIFAIDGLKKSPCICWLSVVVPLVLRLPKAMPYWVTTKLRFLKQPTAF